MDTKKRAATADANNTSGNNKRQATLFSMFKPLNPKKADQEETEAAVTESSPEEARQILSDLDDEKKELLNLEMTTMHHQWLKVLKPELTKPYFLKLKKFLLQEKNDGQTIYPPENEIYSWSNYTPPSNVKIVIIGQDPYHGPGQAHGLCFSVKKGVPPPPSLVNMYKALEKDYPDFKKPNHGYLANWAKQGVLLLNTSLTVRKSNAASHSGKGWEEFTDAVINYINEKKSNVVFLLWGSHAQKKGAKINKSKHLILKSVHPSPLSAHRGFFDCQHFKKANEFLESKGRPTINWNCLIEEQQQK
ncbi:uracil-DNA glycosylase-like protein [Cunninghamella echinulata]|nr:uracil-DNA glycosylase-like protein [Cunninghamella echinulata]